MNRGRHRRIEACMEHLDAKTPVYLERLRRLSPIDRRILSAVGRLDRPARLTEISTVARMPERSFTATYLTRLRRRGVIRAIGEAPRHRYELADPVMAAWWWMRYRSSPGHPALPAHHLRAVARALRAKAA